VWVVVAPEHVLVSDPVPILDASVSVMKVKEKNWRMASPGSDELLVLQGGFGVTQVVVVGLVGEVRNPAAVDLGHDEPQAREPEADPTEYQRQHSFGAS
jgi:hypothetical protein